MRRPITTMLTAFVTALAVAAVAVPGALAKNGDGVRVAGKCTSAATAKLKLGSEDRGIEVEFEVDQNRNGVPWRVTLRRNGSLVASVTIRTHAPSGSFSLNRVIAGTAGKDRIVAVAKSPSGATCTATASL
jgi:hypothetical protein